MGVLIKNADITIYKHYLDENRLDAYQRINIDDVNWKSKRNYTVVDKGINVFYTTMIVAPNSNYNFTTGDKVVKGHIEVDIKRLKELDLYNPITIIGLQENDLLNTINIECK